MIDKGHVLKYGRGLSIGGGEAWAMPNRHDAHFALSPKMGCRGANIIVGLHKPGKEFAPHKRPISKKVLIIYNGKGKRYLYDKWIPVETRDIAFVPPGVLHDTHNPAEDTKDFVTLGIAAPSQPDPYSCAGYGILEDNSGEYVGGV